MPLAVSQMVAVSNHQHTKLKELDRESNESKHDRVNGKKIRRRICPPICKKQDTTVKQWLLMIEQRIVHNDLDTCAVWCWKEAQ